MSKHYFDRLEKIDHLIRIKGTGSPQSLSKKLGVSERTVYAYLDILKSLGASITYSKYQESYIYDPDGYFNFRFVHKG